MGNYGITDGVQRAKYIFTLIQNTLKHICTLLLRHHRKMKSRFPFQALRRGVGRDF